MIWPLLYINSYGVADYHTDFRRSAVHSEVTYGKTVKLRILNKKFYQYTRPRILGPFFILTNKTKFHECLSLEQSLN